MHSEFQSTFSTRNSHDIRFSIVNQEMALISHGVIEQSYTPDNQLELHIILAYNSLSLDIPTIIGITQLAMEANLVILGAEKFNREMTHIMFGITESQIDLLTIMRATNKLTAEIMQDEFLVMPMLSYSN